MAVHRQATFPGLNVLRRIFKQVPILAPCTSQFRECFESNDSHHDLSICSLASEGDLLMLLLVRLEEEEGGCLVAEIPQLPRLPRRRDVFFDRGRCRDRKIKLKTK